MRDPEKITLLKCLDDILRLPSKFLWNTLLGTFTEVLTPFCIVKKMYTPLKAEDIKNIILFILYALGKTYFLDYYIYWSKEIILSLLATLVVRILRKQSQLLLLLAFFYLKYCLFLLGIRELWTANFDFTSLL